MAGQATAYFLQRSYDEIRSNLPLTSSSPFKHTQFIICLPSHPRHYHSFPPGHRYNPYHQSPIHLMILELTLFSCRLQTQLLQSNVTLLRRHYTHLDTLFHDFPAARAVFNCTGLGARHLGGVADEAVYPTKGQTILVAQPKEPLKRMYIQHNASWGDNEFAHVFPRPLGGGVIIGGVRRDNDWTGEPDMELAERIKKRCCALAPELGRPEDLQIISHNVGLRRMWSQTYCTCPHLLSKNSPDSPSFSVPVPVYFNHFVPLK